MYFIVICFPVSDFINFEIIISFLIKLLLNIPKTIRKRTLISAIYKTRNTWTGNGMRGMRSTWGMFTRILGNLLEDSGECYFLNIPGNVQEDSGKCSRRFRGMFKKILGNVIKDSGECSRRFPEMLLKIPGSVPEDFGGSKFRFISWNLACFLSNFAVKLLQNNTKK